MRTVRSGTKVGFSLDAGKVGAAVSRPGIDPRVWFAEGVVATIGDEGEVNDADPDAVISAPEGREADVVLLPELEHYVTCRIPSGGPQSTEDWPIGPGDHVALAFPGGDGASGAILLAVLNSAADRLPVEGGRPMFQHDRRLIWARDVPIDLRAGSGPGRLVLTQSGQVLAGGPDATEQAVQGTSYRAEEKLVLDLINVLADAVNLAIAAATGPSPPQKAAVLAAQGLLKTAIEQFNGHDHLSDVLKLK